MNLSKFIHCKVDEFEVARVNAQELQTYCTDFKAKEFMLNKLKKENEAKDREIANLKQQLCIDGKSPFVRLYA